MKYLFFFAHPDDETVACGGTIRRLVDNDDEIYLVLATDGSAGKVDKSAKYRLKKYGTVANLRKNELDNACQILGVKNYKILDFVDGELTNIAAWGKLCQQFIKEINKYKPDVVITFDHSGWYFHLDHIAVSIATTLAVNQSSHKPDIFMFSLFRPKGIEKRWNYVFSKKLPVTHDVNIKSFLDVKITALKAYASQKFGFSQYLEKGEMTKEYYQLVSCTDSGKTWLKENKLFRPS